MLKGIYVQSKIYKSDSHNSYNLNEFLDHRKHVLDFSKIISLPVVNQVNLCESLPLLSSFPGGHCLIL